MSVGSPITLRPRHLPQKQRPTVYLSGVYIFGQQVHAKSIAIMFKVIPEGKVPEHFEKGMVSCCIAYIFQIIMLRPPAGIFGWLRARLYVLMSSPRKTDLNWTIRHGKKQGRVIAWYE